jgi:hypothetical protein
MKTRRRPVRCTPRLEALEDRALPSGIPVLPNLPANPTLSLSTVPPNGDVNPYGVAFVPQGFPKSGPLNPGDILVSNFNNSNNFQGTGTTIVRVTPSGQLSVFFQGHQGLGLTTALGILRGGFVIVGNLPTTDGTSATVRTGSLLVIDSHGHRVATLSDPALLDGPWDLAINDQGNTAQVFVSDVLSGSVTRIDMTVSGRGVQVQDMVRIASGYLHRSDPAALEIGPTGLAYDASRDVLYVAATGGNAVYAIANAGHTFQDQGRGTLVLRSPAHFHGPLGLVLAPNGDLIATQGDAINTDPNHSNEIVEFTPAGHFVAQFQLDRNGNGGAFGLAIAGQGDDLVFAAADDVTNFLDVWKIDVDGSGHSAAVIGAGLQSVNGLSNHHSDFLGLTEASPSAVDGFFAGGLHAGEGVFVGGR